MLAITDATGQPLACVPVFGDELTAALRQHHLPGPPIIFLVSLVCTQAQQKFNLTASSLSSYWAANRLGRFYANRI